MSALLKFIPPCFIQFANVVQSFVAPETKVFDLEPAVDLFTVAIIFIFALA